MEKGAGVIFVGGKALRLGGISKADINIVGRSCFERVQAVMAKQFDTVAISVAQPTDHTHPTILDWPNKAGDSGVIFSVLAVLKWARDSAFDYVVTSPCDTPFLPRDFADQLIGEFNGDVPVVCASGGRVHNLHAIWPASLFDALKERVLVKQDRRIGRVHELFGSAYIEFDIGPVDPFLNINTPEDVTRAEKYSSEFSL